MAIAIDFETYYSSKNRYSVKTMIPEQYCAHDLFNPYMVSVCDGTSAWSGEPKDFNWDSVHGEVLLSHNRRFDNAVFNEMKRRGQIPSHVVPAAWHCTANLTSYICNRRALSYAVEFLYKTNISKQVRSDAVERNWPKDFTAEERAAMLKYAKEDSVWCHRLWKDYGDKWPETERRLSTLTIDQGIRGVQIDTDRLESYINETHDMKLNTEKLIPWVSGAEDEDWDDFKTKPTATKCIAEQCRRVGIVCPPTKSKDEEGYEAWEEKYKGKYAWVQAVGAWRSINNLHNTFKKVKERLRGDGSLPFSLKYFGAHTGRWSGDSKVNMQNMRKLPALETQDGLLEQNEKRIAAACDEHEKTGKWPSWVRMAIDFRALVIPRDGKKMIVSDLSQIEPRVLAWIVGDQKMLDYVRAGKSVYEAHARASMGYTDAGKMDKNSLLYKLAKARILGLGYQCGWEKFITMAFNLARLDITAEDPEWTEEEDPWSDTPKKVSGYGLNSKKTVAEFRSQNKKIVDLWGQMDAGFKRSASDRPNSYEVELPSGRVMSYRDVRQSITIKKDKVTGKPRQEWVFTAETNGERKIFYGGKLTENLVQATARDVFGYHLLRLEDNGWTNLFSVHDEAVLEVDQDVTKKDVEHEMSQCPDWLKGCPLGAEAKEVKHYLK